MRNVVSLAATLLLVSACDSPKRAAVGAPEPVTAQDADSAFKAMDHRHGEVVGDDPMALEHQFVATPDGGDIILERQIHEDMGINQIRAHLLLIARSFKRGDFSLPGFVHDKPVPGTAVMSDRADKIDYAVEDLPHGGVVHIQTKDPEALTAIHSFIAFQIAEHRTAVER
ncbi:MAG: hypothetical protein ABR582_10490 [Gemmatimonadaceae bacterium]